MKSSLVLALVAAPAAAFQQPAPTTTPARPSTSLNSLRDIASYPDGRKMMSEFEAFDRNGAFSRQGGGMGGGGGRPDMMMYNEGGYGGGYNPNPFSRRGNDRMYTRDGFDPYSAYGNSFGMSQSDNRRRNGGGGMDFFPPDMMGGGAMMGRREMNGVRNDNTMGGFSYSSRVREYGAGRPYDYDMEMMGGGFDGPPPMGGMEYEQGGFGGGYATPARREHPAGPQRPPSSSRPQYTQGSRVHS